MRRSSVVVRCDAGVEVQAQAVAKAASIAALEQFKISADRECFAPSPVCLSSTPPPLLPFLPAASFLSEPDDVLMAKLIMPAEIATPEPDEVVDAESAGDWNLNDLADCVDLVRELWPEIQRCADELAARFDTATVSTAAA